MYIIPMNVAINEIRKFVGNVTFEQLCDVDYFLGDYVALFTPSTGPCLFSTTPNHSHPAYSFILGFDNFCKVGIDGKILQSKPGMISAFSPRVEHHEIITEEFTRYVAIQIQADYFKKQVREYMQGAIPEFRADEFHASIELRNCLKNFMIEYQNKLPGFRQVLNAIGLNIVHSIIRIIFHYDTPRQEIGSRTAVNDIIEYMHLYYNRKLTVDDMSGQIRMSSSHFSRIFRKETGKSPLEYLIHVRLQKAKKLILSSDKSLTEIAHDTGFNSSAHFTASFTKHFRITPSEFKKAM